MVLGLVAVSACPMAQRSEPLLPSSSVFVTVKVESRKRASNRSTPRTTACLRLDGLRDFINRFNVFIGSDPGNDQVVGALDLDEGRSGPS